MLDIRPTIENRYRDLYNNGFILVEVIVVLAILGILTIIAVPSVLRYVEMTEEMFAMLIDYSWKECMTHICLLRILDHTMAVIDLYL